jgi:hypothetical protein
VVKTNAIDTWENCLYLLFLGENCSFGWKVFEELLSLTKNQSERKMVEKLKLLKFGFPSLDFVLYWHIFNGIYTLIQQGILKGLRQSRIWDIKVNIGYWNGYSFDILCRNCIAKQIEQCLNCRNKNQYKEIVLFCN